MRQTNLEILNVTRTCYVCGETKPLYLFKKSKKGTHGYAYECLDCSRTRARKYVREHADERNAKRREKYKHDKEWREKEKQRNRERIKKPEIRNKTRLNYNNQDAYERAYNQTKLRCSYKTKRKTHPFDISLEYALDIAKQQNDKCALTGIPFTFKKTGEKYHDALLPSMDRINSNFGYIIGNIQWTTIWANRAKQHYSDQFFQEMCLHTVKNKINNLESFKYPIPLTYEETYIQIEYIEPYEIEINPELNNFSNTFNPLRKCKQCGYEAWNEEEVKNFAKTHKKCFFGRKQLCKTCYNKRQRKKTKKQNQWTTLFNWLHSPLRKCTHCGKEAWITTDLTLFRKGYSREKYGRMNMCKNCENEYNKQRRKQQTI